MTTKEDEEYITKLENELIKLSSTGATASPSYATSYSAPQKQNLVEWQLDFRSELQDIQHVLRCDVVAVDDKTHKQYWARNPDDNAIVFNERGVNDILREILMFLNKNKVLSNYREEQIAKRVAMIAHELNMLVYNNYEKYGIDNEYKMNNYPIIIISIMAMIEDSYRRAINGEERRDLNSARVVSQTEPLSLYGGQGMGMAQQPKKKHWYTPWRF